MRLDNLENIVKELHRLNFGQNGLIRFAPDGSDYNFTRLEEGKHKFDTEPQLCTLCSGCEGKAAFTRVTHGTHTFDFLDAHGVDHNTVADWSQRPVLFAMENPGALDKRDRAVGARHVSEQWYWVMGQYDYEQRSEYTNKDYIYPKFFVQKEYGWMIYSVIRTFQMANAYVTNMVKCGMTSNGTNYLTTDKYPNKDSIAKDCIDHFLKKELNALRRGNNGENVIVFAFGERTYYRLKEELKDENITLYLLPHPANRLANDDRKYVLFGKILRALLQNHFYDNVKEKPNFEAILAADKDIEPEESREEFCERTLKEISQKRDPKIKIKKREGYAKNLKDTSIGYQFVYLKDPQGIVSDELEALILKQRLVPPVKLSHKNHDYEFHVSWAEYNIRTKAFRLFAGEKNSSNILIEAKDADEKNFPILGVITAFADAYQAKYESPNGSDQE